MVSANNASRDWLMDYDIIKKGNMFSLLPFTTLYLYVKYNLMLIEIFWHFNSILSFLSSGVTTSQPEIWFLDRSLEWSYLASSFMDYFRMMIVHLGLPLWQYLFTSTGLSPETKVGGISYCECGILAGNYTPPHLATTSRILVKCGFLNCICLIPLPQSSDCWNNPSMVNCSQQNRCYTMQVQNFKLRHSWSR